MTTTIFLSHAAPDIDLVRQVERHASVLDIRTYTYEDDPRPGGAVASKLQESIRESDLVVVLLTRHSQHRPSVHSELGIAKALGKLIIPVIEVGVDPYQFVFLQGLEWVSLDPEKAETAFLDIQRQLGRIAAAKERQATLLIAILVLGLIYAIAKRG